MTLIRPQVIRVVGVTMSGTKATDPLIQFTRVGVFTVTMHGCAVCDYCEPVRADGDAANKIEAELHEFRVSVRNASADDRSPLLVEETPALDRPQ